jgi:hypothetical protein
MGAPGRHAVGVAAVITACVVGVAYAQTPNGTITGVVTDASGARVVNAGVTIANRQTGQAWALTTSADGMFTIPALLPGEYGMTVAL